MLPRDCVIEVATASALLTVLPSLASVGVETTWPLALTLRSPVTGSELASSALALTHWETFEESTAMVGADSVELVIVIHEALSVFSAV